MQPWLFYKSPRCRRIRTVCRTKHTQASLAERVRHDLRALLRETAQPVAVVTSLMPKGVSSHFAPNNHKDEVNQHRSKHSHFHGATLSSFSSIAMDPHPLVAFSLRIPSRMATTLKNAHKDTPAWPLATHMVVNILSAQQADVAVRFSCPDAYPHPFEDTSYRLTEEGLPMLEGSLGALSCKLVAASWPLHDLESLKVGHGKKRDEGIWEGDGVPSELFIAQVTRVERVDAGHGKETNGDEVPRTPLLYHRRSYATTRSISGHTLPSSKSKPAS